MPLSAGVEHDHSSGFVSWLVSERWTMAAYGVGIVAETRFGPAIQDYLERIDETLRPYGGKFLIHGGP